MQLAFQAYGSFGDPLIVLHGLFGSRESWHSACMRLAEDFVVYALDQRNHGDSPRSQEMDYRAMAEDVREFMDQQALPWAHVLGHSMGAKTAMQFALTRGERTRSLISVDMAPRGYQPRHERILEGLRALDLKSLPGRREMEQALEPWVPDLPTRRFLLKNARRSAKGFHWRIGLEEINGNYARLSEPVCGEPYRGPALFVRGELSDYVLAEDLPGIRALFPNAQLVTISSAGHLLHVEKPEEFLEAVRGFLVGQR